jgi:hypothetical protein
MFIAATISARRMAAKTECGLAGCVALALKRIPGKAWARGNKA